ncbi:MAG: response regulator transcription factor [Chloroflexi bacterium]|nr:response regulator transcription factor [Chloroflexota bacterium]
MHKIRVLLADDHNLITKGLQALLNYEPDIQVLGQALDGREAMRLVEELKPDVLVIDLEMPGMSGLEALRQLKKRGDSVRVVVLTMHKETKYIVQVLRAGAAGYILKDAAVADLVNGIRTAYAGDVFLSPPVSTRLVAGLIDNTNIDTLISPVDALTDREREVLQLIGEGRQRQEIANILCLSPKTVDTHRANLMRKLGAGDNATLVRLAIQHGIVSLDS